MFFLTYSVNFIFILNVFISFIFELLNTQNPYESSLFDIPKKVP